MSSTADSGLSQAQAAAVTDTRSQVLVAAAAGSGKTRLLVASVVRALVEEQLPIDRLVAVTFTRKAGAELASRVREALEACGRNDLALSLDAAMVGTIDSLCRRVVKERALEAAVDPGCGVMEAEVADLLKADVIRSSWETVSREADDERLQVLARQGVGLRREVVVLYDRLRALGLEEPRVDIPAGPSEEQARERLVRVVEAALAVGAERERPSVSLGADLERLSELLVWLEGPAQGRVGEVALKESAGYFPSRRTRTMEDHFAPVRAALADYRSVLAEDVLSPIADLVNALLLEFHREYTAAKAERGLMDFADLGLKARALLTPGDADDRGGAVSGAPSMVGAFLLVDEFQDTNELQCAILSQLGADRTLMVGDERQSIYRFRGADVDVFKKRREALASAEIPASEGSLHRLDVNYRSSKEILDFINGLFSHAELFGEEFVRLSADTSRARVGPPSVVGGRAGAVGADAAVSVLVAGRRHLEGDDGRLVSGRQAEAEALAREVRGLVEVEGWRQRDIVVLLPTQIEVEAYREALLREGLDVYVVRGKGYYTQEEVTDVTSLLRVLVSPHDDLALLTVLRSPLVGLSDDGLYVLGQRRRAQRAHSIWEVLGDESPEGLDSEDRAALELFMQRSRQLRSRVGRPGLARFIDEAISAFSYDLVVLGAPEGRMRFANVRKLMRLADEFEAAEGPDLTRFLSVVRSMGQVSDREGSAPTLGENDEVVRIMTIHQAKGLEFPVVVLAGLGADSHRPEASTFVVGADGRVGMFLKGFRNSTYEDYDPHWGPAAEIAADEVRRECEEDVRLLYVAMTRAQERLVLVGARPAKNAMGGSRIGRIVGALGLSEFPADNETLAARDLPVTVTGVGPVGETAVGLRHVGEGISRSGPAARDGGAAPEAALEWPGPPDLPKTPDAVGAPERVSFSTLAAYARCPRQFYLERVLGLEVSEGRRRGEEREARLNDSARMDPEERHAGRDVGTVVHRVLEQNICAPDRPAEEDLLRAAADAAEAMRVRLNPEEVERAVRLSLAAWDSPATARSTSSRAEPEVPFFFVNDGVMVVGIMDLLYRASECWYVTDYKTNALRGRSIEALSQEYALQAAVYGLAALRAGAPAVHMELVFLERPQDVMSVEYRPDDIPRLERELSLAMQGLRQGSYPRHEGEDCTRCPVAGMCRRMVAD